VSGRRVSVATLLELPMRERLRTLRGRDTQAAFAAETGFSIRQVKRWEKGDAAPTRESAEDLAAATGYPVRVFLPPPEPTLRELSEKLDRILAALNGGRRRR
jgi:transcriptional regulator with XRE-family HTH domain